MGIQFAQFFFVLFCVQNFCCNDSKYHSLNWKDVSVTNVDIFEKKQFSLQFFYSLLQVYIVHRVSFIFHLDVLLVAVCTRGFAYLLCWPRGRGIGLVCTRRFSFHEFYNFLPFNFLIFIFFGRLFLTRDIYAHSHPRTTPTTHDLYPLPMTVDIYLHSIPKTSQRCKGSAVRLKGNKPKGKIRLKN